MVQKNNCGRASFQSKLISVAQRGLEMLNFDSISISKVKQSSSPGGNPEILAFMAPRKPEDISSLLTLFTAVHSESEKCSTVTTPAVQVIFAYSGLTPCNANATPSLLVMFQTSRSLHYSPAWHATHSPLIHSVLSLGMLVTSESAHSPVVALRFTSSAPHSVLRIVHAESLNIVDLIEPAEAPPMRAATATSILDMMTIAEMGSRMRLGFGQ
eukprot:SAG11_NODE_3277_length_2558_cov_1.573810_1_plen_213_part_00